MQVDTEFQHLCSALLQGSSPDSEQYKLPQRYAIRALHSHFRGQSRAILSIFPWKLGIPTPGFFHGFSLVSREISEIIRRFALLSGDADTFTPAFKQWKERGIEDRINVSLVGRRGMRGGCELGDAVPAKILVCLNNPKTLDLHACRPITRRRPVAVVHKEQIWEVVDRHS